MKKLILYLLLFTSLVYIGLQLIEIYEARNIIYENLANFYTKTYELKDLFSKPTPTISQKKTPYVKSAPNFTPKPKPKTEQSNEEWGVAKKIGEHSYTIKLGPDERMGSANEIYEALNRYRERHGRSYLAWSDTLAQYSQSRADHFKAIKGTDEHAGFSDFLDNQDGFAKLGFSHLGENSYYGAPLLGVHVIEWVFASSEEHNANQLDSSWSHVGIGVNDVAVNIIFGGS